MSIATEIKLALAGLPEGDWILVEGDADEDGFDPPRVIIDEPSRHHGVETPIATVSNGSGTFIANSPRYVKTLLARVDALETCILDALSVAENINTPYDPKLSPWCDLLAVMAPQRETT